MKISGLFVFALVSTCFAQDQPLRHSRRPARYVSRPMQNAGLQPNAVQNAAVATLPIWQTTSGAYNYQMVGTNPMVAGAGTTTITTNVIPLILTFSDGTVFDPTVANACSPQAPQSLVLSSPLFNNSAYTAGSVSLGTTQYLDGYQRANFWQYTSPAGISPNYHTLLSASPVAAIRISVPAASGSTVASPCGKLGEMDINWFDTYVQTTVFTQLATLGVVPSGFPLFVLYNTVMYQGTSASCCILGYHSGFNNPNFASAVQTYAVADFDTSGDFASSPDLSSLTHEVGEWLDDPTGNNPTPWWGHVGQVGGCQNNLENGDPLSGTIVAITMSNGFTYHAQELAFKSWFYHDVPSIGVNGWYSSNGTFKSPALPCEVSVTSLNISPTSIAAGSATTVKITVGPGSGFTGIPGGSVSLAASNSATPLATYALSSGAVSTTAVLPAGSYNLTANYTGDLNFAAGSSAAVAVTVGSASVSLSPVSLSFAGQNTGTSSAAQAVTFTNSGTAPVSISSVSFTGAVPADYSQSNNCGSSVAVGAKCTISVIFTPTATGTRTASLSIADNATGSPQTVPVTGSGVVPPASPTISVGPASLTFTGTSVGVAGAAQAVTVKNTGTVSVTISSISVSGGDFSSTTTCGASLAAGLSCTVSVVFKPTTAGTRTGSLSVADNATGSPQQVSLTGTGAVAAPKVTLSPASLTFASTTVGTGATAQKVTMTNTGTAAMTVSSIKLSGTNAADFAQTNTCGTGLAANASCTISVTFRPVAKGSRGASVSIADNVAGSPQIVSLSGAGK